MSVFGAYLKIFRKEGEGTGETAPDHSALDKSGACLSPMKCRGQPSWPVNLFRHLNAWLPLDPEWCSCSPPPRRQAEACEAPGTAPCHRESPELAAPVGHWPGHALTPSCQKFQELPSLSRKPHTLVKPCHPRRRGQ